MLSPFSRRSCSLPAERGQGSGTERVTLGGGISRRAGADPGSWARKETTVPAPAAGPAARPVAAGTARGQSSAGTLTPAAVGVRHLRRHLRRTGHPGLRAWTPRPWTAISAQGRAGRQVGAEEAGGQLCHCWGWLWGGQQVGVWPRAGTPVWCESSASASPWLSSRHRQAPVSRSPCPSATRPVIRSKPPSLSGKALLCKANGGFLPLFSEQDVVPAARHFVYAHSNPSVYLMFKTGAYNCTAVRSCFSQL